MIRDSQLLLIGRVNRQRERRPRRLWKKSSAAPGWFRSMPSRSNSMLAYQGFADELARLPGCAPPPGHLRLHGRFYAQAACAALLRNKGKPHERLGVVAAIAARSRQTISAERRSRRSATERSNLLLDPVPEKPRRRFVCTKHRLFVRAERVYETPVVETIFMGGSAVIVGRKWWVVLEKSDDPIL
jgi:hypothetical protein